MAKKKGFLTFTDRSSGAPLHINADMQPESILEVWGDQPHETPGARVTREAAQQPPLKRPVLGTDFVLNGKNHRVTETIDQVREAFGVDAPEEEGGDK